MKKSALLAALTACLTSCGGGSPLSFWLVTADQRSDPVCVPAPTALPTQTDTQSGIVQAATWELYQGAKDSAGKDTFILQMGTNGSALVGSKDGSKYTFTGTDTRVSKTPTAEAPTRTDTDVTTTTVDFTIDGSTLSGTATESVSHSCAGTNCPMPMNPQPCSTSSTTTTTFHATQVQAEIKHDV